jgi:methyl-accepting chemotaxis protein
MRLRLSLPFKPLKRLIASFSVRTRIVLLALVPVVGFVANGVTYLTGEREVGVAFETMRRADRLADASRDFQNAVEAMRIAVKDFTATPSDELVESYDRANLLAAQSLDTIERTMDRQNAETIATLRKKIADLKGQFTDLVREQRTLGFDENSGLRGNLRRASIGVERIINENMTWLDENEAKKLMMSLLIMRHHEADYRLLQHDLIRQQFHAAHKTFNETFARIDGTPEMKSALETAVKTYADTFEQWVSGFERVRPLRVIMDLDSQGMLPHADELIVQARLSASTAATDLSVSEARTRNGIISIGIGIVALGLVFSFLIGRSIVLPLNGLAGAMKNLAAGNTEARIPATQARDEIGEMARTVIVFRDTMLEREQLAANQAQTSRAREQRSETIAQTITDFKTSVENALGKLRAAAMKLEMSAADLNRTADTVSGEAHSAEQRVTAASSNVTSAASSIEELAASIGEISTQAGKSTEVAARAVSEAQRTVTTMAQLGNAATRIGEVIGLIQSIAGQTNLLALNATIEAARAGESGRGFAVVAAEVKSLAGQTAKATDEIADQVGSIQSAAADAVQAIEQVNAIIRDMSSIATSVAATVDQQNSAMAAIAEGVSRASNEARVGAESMSRVAGVTTDARATAADVSGLADTVAAEAEGLEAEIRRFLHNVQAA